MPFDYKLPSRRGRVQSGSTQAMGQGYPRLLGDIGGTNARWAWVAQAGDAPSDISVRRCIEHASPGDSAREYLAHHRHPAPNWMAIGVATPVTGDQVRLTNHPWSFSIVELQRALGARRCLVINDFTALALSLPLLGARELRAIGDNAARRAPREGEPLALLGPGTGLGISGLLPVAGGWPISGEGGHATLAAADDEETALIACLRRRFGHVSAERVLSGQGLVNLYEAVCALDKHPARALDATDVTRAALDATDERCVRAVGSTSAAVSCRAWARASTTPTSAPASNRRGDSRATFRRSLPGSSRPPRPLCSEPIGR